MTSTLGPTDEQVRSMRENVMERIAPDARAQNSRRRFALAAVGVAAAAALVAGIVLLPDGSGASAEAATILNGAADLTITTSDLVAQPGQYLRIETMASYGRVGTADDGSKVSWLMPETTVVYKPVDPDAEWVMERRQLIPTEFFGKGAEEAALTDWETTKTIDFLNGTFRAEDAAFYGTPDPTQSTDALPRDPRQLYDRIRGDYNGGSSSRDEDAWVRITELLRTGTAPADLRSALYAAAAMIPGIEVTATETTINGRSGVAIGRLEPHRDQRQEIVIDPATGELLGERTVMTAAKFSAPVGTAWGATTVTTTVVDAAP
jgi:hypothetical protein